MANLLFFWPVLTLRRTLKPVTPPRFPHVLPQLFVSSVKCYIAPRTSWVKGPSHRTDKETTWLGERFKGINVCHSGRTLVDRLSYNPLGSFVPPVKLTNL